MRASNGRYEPDVEQLGQLFLGGAELGQKIRDFQDSRISKIMGQSTPIVIDGSVLAMHLIPYSAFKSGNRLSVEELRACDKNLAPFDMTHGWHNRPNLDGLVLFPDHLPDHTERAYTQIWRRGIIEAVGKLPLRDENICLTTVLEQYIHQSSQYINAMKELGIRSPVAIFITLVNVKGLTTDIPNSMYCFDRDVIKTTEVIINDIETFDTDALIELLRPILNEIANAAGSDNWRKLIR